MRILFIGPHPDDCEIAAAGTVARFVAEGHEVWFHILGKAFENSIPKPSENLYQEAEKAAKTLGICNLHIDDFPFLKYPDHAFEIRESLERTAAVFNPQMVFLPTEHDLHQDHVTCSLEAQRAFRSNEELIAYNTVSSRHGFNPNLFINIEKYMGVKDEVLQMYETQAGKPYFMNRDWVHMAAYWAHKSNYSLRTPVEAFEILRKFM